MLPKIDLPTYNITLPISKEKVTYRPYLSKEQKILLMAIESEDRDTIKNAVTQIINNCVISNIDISKLPIADTEFLFYNLRARSDSETVDLRYKCEAPLGEGVCGHILQHELNLLTDLDIVNKDISNIIQIDDKIGVKLKYITFTEDDSDTDDITADQIFEDVANHIDSVYDENSVYDSKDVSLRERKEFLESLPTDKFMKIEEFFINQPSIEKKIQLKCPKCGTVHNITVENIFSFLD